MENLTDSEKNKIVEDILINVDNLNIILQTPNYIRKYGDIDYEVPIFDNDSLKRHLITHRERFRKILLVEWVNEYFTANQIQDINNTLSLVRQKIGQLFTN